MSDKRVLGIGIVGIGGAAVAMLPAIARNPHFRIAAAADVDTEVLSRFGHDHPEARMYGSVEAICTDPAVDLIYIGTPSKLHRRHAGIALEQRKHVLTEKPMAVSLDEAEAMIAQAAEHGVLLGVNVKHSFEPRIQKIRTLARSGELGRLRMIQSWRYVDWLYRPRSHDEKTPGWGAGILWRQGPHQFDFIRTLGGGMLRSVRGTCLNLDPTRGVAGAYSAFLEFEDGLVCIAICSGYDHFNSRTLVHGFNGEKPLADPSHHASARRELAAHAGSPDWEENAAAGERYGGGTDNQPNNALSSGWLLSGPLIASFEHGDVRFSRNGLIVDGDREQWEIPLLHEGDGRDGRLDSFYRAVVEGRPLSADGRWGKATQEVLIALERSSETHQEILLTRQVPFVDG